ncbi:MAG: YcxB family protein [Tissierellaceae bacterium]
MEYRFKYQPTALELWKLSMYGIFSSLVGITNIIFTISMLLLSIRFWGSAQIIYKIVLIIGICLFTCIQPLAIYLRARKQMGEIPLDMEIFFDEEGIKIISSEGETNLIWKSIKGVKSKADITTIYTTDKYGLILSDRILGSSKEEFLIFLSSKLERKVKGYD